MGAMAVDPEDDEAAGSSDAMIAQFKRLPLLVRIWVTSQSDSAETLSTVQWAESLIDKGTKGD